MSNIQEKPNILFIITDQNTYTHNRPGQFEIEYPRFNQFVSEGVHFERAYSVCPLCTPARSSMMTGMYPSKHGLRWNTEKKSVDNLTDFKQGQQLYSHYLSQKGYRNSYIGKWHCGHEKLPVDYGMEGWSLPDYGKVYMSEKYKEYTRQRGLGDARAEIEHSVNHPEWEGQTLTLHDPSPWTFMNGSGTLQGPPEAHEQNFVAQLASEKIKELAANKQPWSLVASFWGPHQPYFPTEPYASMISPSSIPEYPSFHDDLKGRPLRQWFLRDYNHKGTKRWEKDWSIWQEILAKCYGQAIQTDAAIGSLLDTLKELGIEQNTLVIWCADHGDAVASHGGLWDKGATFSEEVGRIPLAIRWPERFKGGHTIDDLVSNMDITATILDAAGLQVPEDMDSRSLIPLCESKAVDWSDHLICEHNGHKENIIQRIVMYENYKYVAALYDSDELYDLKVDPYEMNNLIDSHEYQDVKADLRLKIIKHIEWKDDHVAEQLAYALKNDF